MEAEPARSGRRPSFMAADSSVGAQGGIRGGRRDSCCFSVDASPAPSFKAPGGRRSFAGRKGSVAGADSSRRGSLMDATRRRGSVAAKDGTRRASLAGVDESQISFRRHSAREDILACVAARASH